MKRLSSRHRALWSGLVFSLLVAPASVGADTPPMLRFDPFGSRPEIEPRPRSGTENASTFAPVLLSTIVRGDRSLVNLGGEILALDEESQGYRLLEVHPFDALFLKDGQEIRLQVTQPGDTLP
jgi:hypothetical protein